MITYQRLLGALGLPLLFAFANCADGPEDAAPITLSASGERPDEGASEHFLSAGKLTQFGTLDQLNRGVLDGSARVWTVAQAGDFGVGTFNALDGEMMVLDGVVYQFTADGQMKVANSNLRTPFAAVTRFSAERSFNAAPLTGYAALQGFITTSLPNQNMPYAIKVKGTFSSLKTRSPRRQELPYPTLAEAVTTQATFDHTNISGTMVGFRLPAYFGTTNAAGYHFHFVSDDRTKGGHVLDVSVASAVVQSRTITETEMHIEDED